MKRKSVILDIFYGFRGNKESMDLPKNQITEKLTPVADAYDELKQKLSPELFSLLEKFEDALHDYNLDELNNYYVEGFKLGLLIGIEAAESR